jgi:GNAT superfamily N-acetyltransferase
MIGGADMNEVREADLARDLNAIRDLWLEYLSWGNDELETRHGFRLPIEEAVEHDLVDIAKFQPPGGCILLGITDEVAVGVACMQRIGHTTAEVKRMYVRPGNRRKGLGRALLDRLIETARADHYDAIRLDSPDFMTAAHALYRSSGFVDIEPYAESEIPDQYKEHWVFMEKSLT